MGEGNKLFLTRRDSRTLVDGILYPNQESEVLTFSHLSPIPRICTGCKNAHISGVFILLYARFEYESQFFVWPLYFSVLHQTLFIKISARSIDTDVSSNLGQSLFTNYEFMLLSRNNTRTHPI